MVSIIIVSFNTKEHLRKCLASVRGEHEVIVVDNASLDGSPQMVKKEFPNVILIENNHNVGFGTANNQGLGVAKGDLVFFLNSDIVVEQGSVERLEREFKDQSVVAVGGRLLNPDGSLQNSSSNTLTLWAVFCEQTLIEKLFPSSYTFSPYWNSHRFTQVSDTEQVMGACLMMRPVEKFNEKFFLYCEDTELCRRLRTHGRILYVPEATFIHDLGASSARMRWLSIARYNRGKELYFELYQGKFAAAICLTMNRLGALMRLLGWFFALPFTKGSKGAKQVSTFYKVLVAPLAGPPDPRAAGLKL